MLRKPATIGCLVATFLGLAAYVAAQEKRQGQAPESQAPKRFLDVLRYSDTKVVFTRETTEKVISIRGPARGTALDLIQYIQVTAREYIIYDHYDKKANLLPESFPLGDTGWVPPTPCCKKNPATGLCSIDPAEWTKGPWKAFPALAKTSGLYFQIRYSSQGTGKDAKYRVELRGDPGCLGLPLTLVVEEKVDNGGWFVTRTLTPL